MAVLKDVVLAYVKIQQPAQKYETEGAQNTEWTVDCIIDEKTAKRWKKEFKKQPPKEFDNKEFKEVFKIDPPYPEQEEQYVVKLKKDTHYKDKETGRLKQFDPKYRVKVYEKIGLSEDGKPLLKDITKLKLVSNGSTGVVMYDVITNKFGTFAKLKAVRVDNLIEYQAADSVDELGEVVEGGDYSSEPEDADDDDFGSDAGDAEGDDDDAPFDPDEDDSDY
ncbi:MAG: hypothetical protein GOVbin1096_36 [Prokaryotic dsDNA virus sp.]|jgi:hypothetical protein|nr:MAG: hypothetical protein GOVbin1096_36 [Prokaryotic dsDNA virus sp.]|tara:strand:+ start:59142 stop:59804 length:663 start_codon:yes stop_codon:yes gene_type:complete